MNDKIQRQDIEKSISEIHALAGELFEQAVTHSSYALEYKVQDNEILEFLGDSVLQLCVTQLLIQMFPKRSEGDLSLIRHRAVNNQTLFMLTKELKLDVALRLGKGEERTGGREKERLLANTFEAFLGAVFSTSGLEKSQELVTFLFSTHIRTKGTITPDKQLLHEWCQQKHGTHPVFKDIGETGPDHAKVYRQEVWIGDKAIATGSGSNKKEASNVAASNAVQILNISSTSKNEKSIVKKKYHKRRETSKVKVTNVKKNSSFKKNAKNPKKSKQKKAKNKKPKR